MAVSKLNLPCSGLACCQLPQGCAFSMKGSWWKTLLFLLWLWGALAFHGPLQEDHQLNEYVHLLGHFKDLDKAQREV